MARLGDINMVVYNERPIRSTVSTDHPVEDGVEISDHISRKPQLLEISGVVTGDTAGADLKTLESYQEKGLLLTYVGRNWYNGVLIESFDSTHDTTNLRAFNFTMTLKLIRRVKAASIQELTLPVKVQSKSVGSKGLQQSQTPAQMAAANNNQINPNL